MLNDCHKCQVPIPPGKAWKINGLPTCEGCAGKAVNELAISPECQEEGERMKQAAWEATGKQRQEAEDYAGLEE